MKITLKRKTRFVFKSEPVRDTLETGVYYEDAAWGVRIVVSDKPRAWVKDCRTGQPIRKEDARCLGRGKDGNYYWIRNGEKIYIGEKSYASIWRKEEIPL